MRRLFSFSPACSLLLLWQASLTGNVESEVDNPVVLTPHRPRTSEISKPLSVSLVGTPPHHHLPALPSKIGELQQNSDKYKKKFTSGFRRFEHGLGVW